MVVVDRSRVGGGLRHGRRAHLARPASWAINVEGQMLCAGRPRPEGARGSAATVVVVVCRHRVGGGSLSKPLPFPAAIVQTIISVSSFVLLTCGV
jgi:hypothetical protein